MAFNNWFLFYIKNKYGNHNNNNNYNGDTQKASQKNKAQEDNIYRENIVNLKYE